MTLSAFHAPFLGGGTRPLAAGVPEPYDCALGNHAYVTEPTKSSRQFITQLRPSQDNSTEPGAQSINPEGLWRRSASSWHEGTGQVWFDSSKDASTHRFRQSKGVDVWTPFVLKMLPNANTKKLVATGTNLKLIFDQAAGRLWVVDGVNVKYADNPSSATPTWSTATGLPGSAITSVTFTGAHIYVVANAVVYRCAFNSGAFSSWYSATSVDGVSYANGRLFGWRTNEIFELTAAPAKVTLFTHPQSSWTWDGVTGAPNASYLYGHLSYSSEIYRTDVTDATGALQAPKLSGSIVNERITAAIVEAGYVILATKGGDGIGTIRLCQIVNPQFTTGGALIIGPNIFSQLGQQPASSIDSLWTIGRFVYFSWPNLDGTCTGAGRMDLQTFTQPLVPAYATDQMAGITSASVQGAVLSLVWDPASSQLWMAVSGVGVYGTTAGGLMTENYLYTGRIRYGLLDSKTFCQLALHTNSVAGTLVHGYLYDDTGNLYATVDHDGAATVGTPIGVQHTTAEWSELELVLVANGSTSPQLSWWVLFAIPIPGALEQIVLALILRDKVIVSSAMGAPEVDFDVKAELDYLQGLVTSRTIVTLQTGRGVEDVYANNVRIEPEQFSQGNDHYEGLVYVELKTLTT